MVLPCLVGLVLAGGLSAQGARLGAAVLEHVRLGWLRPPQGDCRSEARLLAIMPDGHWQYLRALRALAELQSSCGRNVAIAGVLAEQSRRLARLHLRAPAPLIALAVDSGNRLRGLLDMQGADLDLAHALILDRQGELLWMGELDRGVHYLLEDFIAGKVGAQGLRWLMENGRSFDPAGLDSTSRLELEPGDRQRLVARFWQPWAAQIRAISKQRWGKDGPALLHLAIEALEDRPEYLARILRLALDRAPELARRAEVSAAARRVLAGAEGPQVDLLGFIWHAQLQRDDLARSRAIRYIDRFKGVPARLVEFQRRLGATRHADRFVPQQLLALQLASPGDSADADILRDKFNLLVGKLGAYAAAAQVGRELIAARQGDVSFLNAFAWSLLTDPQFKGRMNELALQAALAMRDQDGWRNYWRLDTLARALFENDRVAEAVEFQERAVASCEAGSRARYSQRLERYRQALGFGSPGK